MHVLCHYFIRLIYVMWMGSVLCYRPSDAVSVKKDMGLTDNKRHLSPLFSSLLLTFLWWENRLNVLIKPTCSGTVVHSACEDVHWVFIYINVKMYFPVNKIRQPLRLQNSSNWLIHWCVVLLVSILWLVAYSSLRVQGHSM